MSDKDIKDFEAQALFESEFECVVDGHHGVYVPQVVAERFLDSEFYKHDIDKDDVAILLEGPDGPSGSEFYWDVWETAASSILENVETKEEYAFYIGECGDVFMYRPAIISKWEEENGNFWDIIF